MNHYTPETRSQRVLARRAEFLRKALGEPRALRIVDVGANPINTPDYDQLLKLGCCEVWGFEPNEAAFKELVKYAGPNRHYVQRAIGPTGPAVFHGNRQTSLGSLFPVRRESVTYLSKSRWHRLAQEGVDIDLISLDDLPDDEVPKPDFLKIDIQGGELGVFETGREKLSDAVCVIPEVRFYRIYENEPMLGAVDNELHQQGFVLHKLQFTKSTVVENSQRSRMQNKVFQSQLIDGDAVYIRNPEGMAEWSTDQVMQLAILAGTVFNSFDLAVHCLDELVARDAVDASVPSGFVDQLPPWMLTET